jgi:hypothetical protein
LSGTEAVRALMKNILFFVDDQELSGQVFETACDVAESLPVYRLTFAPDAGVWDAVA